MGRGIASLLPFDRAQGKLWGTLLRRGSGRVADAGRVSWRATKPAESAPHALRRGEPGQPRGWLRGQEHAGQPAAAHAGRLVPAGQFSLQRDLFNFSDNPAR